MAEEQAVQYREITPDDLADLPRVIIGKRACDRCLRWEDANYWTGSDADEILITRKQNWFRTVWQEFGTCGIIAAAENLGVGFTEFALPRQFPGLEEYSFDIEPETPFVACLAVTPEWRGKGVATELLRMAEQSLRNRGYTSVQSIARVDSPNNPAGPVEFWISQGYTATEQTGSLALMKKDL